MRAGRSGYQKNPGGSLLGGLLIALAAAAWLALAAIWSLARWGARRWGWSLAAIPAWLYAGPRGGFARPASQNAAAAATASAPATEAARQYVRDELARRVTAKTLSLDDAVDLFAAANAATTIGELAALIGADPQDLPSEPAAEAGRGGSGGRRWLRRPGVAPLAVGGALLATALWVWPPLSIIAAPLVGFGAGRLVKDSSGMLAAVALAILTALAVLTIGAIA